MEGLFSFVSLVVKLLEGSSLCLTPMSMEGIERGPKRNGRAREGEKKRSEGTGKGEKGKI